jgi:hypothetical protein
VLLAYIVGSEIWLVVATVLRFNLAGQTIARFNKGVPYMPWTGSFLKPWIIFLWAVNTILIINAVGVGVSAKYRRTLSHLVQL